MNRRLQPSRAACPAQERAKQRRIHMVRVTQLWSNHNLLFPFVFSQENLFLRNRISAG